MPVGALATTVIEAPAPPRTGTPPSPLPPREVEGQNPVAAAGFVLTLIYSFALVSLASDIATLVLGVKPYLTLICGPLAILAAFASGNLLRVWNPGPGRYMMLFTAWIGLATVFAIYRAGSVRELQEFTTKQLPVFFMLTALIVNMKQVDRFYRMMGFAGAIIAAISLKYGGYSSIDNRFTLPGTTIENPNDFATHLLMVFPFCVWMLFNGSWFYRLVGIASSSVLGLIILRSESRAGFLTLLAMVAVVLWKSSGSQRAVILAACLVSAVIAVAILPQALWSRFETIFASEATAANQGSDTDSAQTLSRAEASTNARWDIFKRSLAITIHNPIFGVGPGNFAVEDADIAHSEGRRGTWLGTHNSYTQASSEGGIPAFVFFVATLIGSMRVASRIHKRTRRRPELRHISQAALCLLVTVVGFSVNILFSHLDFRFYLPLLAGLTVAFSACAEREIARRAPAAAA